MFNLVDNRVVIDVAVLPIPEFKKIWERDKGKSKEIANKELSYIYYVGDLKSPYSGYDEVERRKHVKKDIVRDDKWVADAEVENAIIKYQELQFSQSPVYRLLVSVKDTLSKLHKYFASVSFEPDSEGKMSHDPEDVIKNMKALGDLITSLDKLEAKVKKDQSDGHVRGGGTVNSRER